MPNKIDWPKILFAIFLIIWTAMAISPLRRFEWFLENIAVFLFLPVVIWSYFKFRLSNYSYFLIFIFAVLHVLASHYTYGDTPWGNWISEIFGWQRNNYDRIVHFLFGFLMAPVASEVLKNYLPASPTGGPRRALIRGFLVFSVIVAIGSLYEAAEFIVGILVRPEAGLAFLGFQGDIWDTQKDILLQAAGAVLGLIFMPKRLIN